MSPEDKELEDALLRRRFDDYTAKGLTVLIPVVIALGGWALSLQTRISEVDTKQEERGPRIASIEQQLKEILTLAREPRPETRVEIKAITDRIDRLEERVNSLHSYILALPIRPAPIPYTPSKRGDLRLEDIIKGGG